MYLRPVQQLLVNKGERPSSFLISDSTVGAGDKKVILKPEFPGMKIHII